MNDFLRALMAGIVSGGVISTILGFIFYRRTARIQADIKSQYDRSLAVFQSTRTWKEKSISELLGPIFMQFDRTGRAFNRWQNKNLFLEAKVIMEGNVAIRDLLLTKSHLIPPELLDDAGKLVEHYDRWVEEFQRLRSGEIPDLDTPFVFVGPQGYPFPKESEIRFRQVFYETWAELYGPKSE
jgi:hypothetical protein